MVAKMGPRVYLRCIYLSWVTGDSQRDHSHLLVIDVNHLRSSTAERSIQGLDALATAQPTASPTTTRHSNTTSHRKRGHDSPELEGMSVRHGLMRLKTAWAWICRLTRAMKFLVTSDLRVIRVTDQPDG